MKITERIQQQRYLSQKSVLVIIIGIGLYMIFLSLSTDIGAVMQAIKSADIRLYSLAFIAAIANIIFHSLTWRNLLDNFSLKPSFQRIYLFIWVGQVVDILVPAESISGEIARGYLLNRFIEETSETSLRNNLGHIMTSILSHRIIYTSISLIGLIGGSIAFEYAYGFTPLLAGLIIFMVGGALFSLLLLILVSFRKRLAWRIVEAGFRIVEYITRGKIDLAGLKPKARSVLDAFHDGFHLLRAHSWSLLIPVGFSIMAWILNLSITFFTLAALDVNIPFSAIIVVFSIIDALQTIPVGVPGEVGIIEIAMTTLYTVLGVLPVVSATITILVRVVTMWFKLLIGIPAIRLLN